jgi:hypothetical protein
VWAKAGKLLQKTDRLEPDVLSYLVGLFVEYEWGSYPSLVVFLSMYVVMLWVAWRLAVWMTAPKPYLAPQYVEGLSSEVVSRRLPNTWTDKMLGRWSVRRTVSLRVG